MAKMRVRELAKELGINCTDIVSALSEEKGIDVKAASSIEDDNIDFIRSKFGAKANKEAEKADKASEKEAKVAEKEGVDKVLRIQTGKKSTELKIQANSLNTITL